MTDKETLKLALEALEYADEMIDTVCVPNAITVIKQALAAPVQDEFDIRGMLASKLTCWNRLRETEANELVALVASLSQPAPVQEPVAWIDSVMEQAQVFASAWSLVGSRFDSGNGLEDAEQAKAELRAMLTTPPAQPAPVQEPHSWYSAEHDEWMTNKTRKEHEALNSYTHKVGGFDLALYTTPPAAQRQWVGLTDECRKQLINEGWSEYIAGIDDGRTFGEWMSVATEAKLKERNA
jgi:hypothetical protein